MSPPHFNESALLVVDLARNSQGGLGLPIYVAQLPLAPLTRMYPAFSPFQAVRPSHRVPRISIRSLQLIQAFGLPTVLP
jgi:hypothetical protein